MTKFVVERWKYWSDDEKYGICQMKIKHKNMKNKIGLLLFVVFLLSSCAFLPKVSRFSNESVQIGMNKPEIVKKFGAPFKTDSYMENHKQVDILYYKEIVWVQGRAAYAITTALRFEDSVLQKMTQTDHLITDKTVDVDSGDKKWSSVLEKLFINIKNKVILEDYSGDRLCYKYFFPPSI